MVFTHPSNSNTQCTINKIVPYVGIGPHCGIWPDYLAIRSSHNIQSGFVRVKARFR